jgi:peptidoglycan/xylan/chitin deacetylase (PgdA/CDA1 family)
MPLTIVMYHYVRDLARSRYPAINARTLDDFRTQLAYIGRHYEVVTSEQVMAAASGDGQLPDNACWLTFDDGYLDHFTNVFPLLDERGWQGSFFIPALPILDGKLLDVNKIHLLLAAERDTDALIEALRRAIDAERESGAALDSWDAYVSTYLRECHLDTPEVLFIKQMLQLALPEGVRHRICDSLFARFVSTDEAAIAAELYLSVDQIKVMSRHGMSIGSHGDRHVWLTSLNRAEQEQEIDRSLAFIRALGISSEKWMICYPYGAYDEATLDALVSRGCALGLTTRSGVAQIGRDAALELPRIDTIDLPVA